MRTLLKKFLDRSAASQPMNRETVIWSYRILLDRDPESETTISDQLTAMKDRRELRRQLLMSEEFKMKNPTRLSTALLGTEPPMAIEPVDSEAGLQALFAHIQDAWQHLSDTEPYWSVLTMDKFLKERMAQERSVAEFYEFGKIDRERISATLERNGLALTDFKSCLEYGCGLGRVTRWLAESFETVYGYDISPTYLRLMREYFEQQGLRNVTLSPIRSVHDVERLPKVDLIYSVIVLQHNPPPLIHFILTHFFRALNPGGVALFQVPTYQRGYRFSLAEYLAQTAGTREMEVHVLPQNRIFTLARQEGCQVLEVIEDAWTGLRDGEVSNTFLIQKIAH